MTVMDLSTKVFSFEKIRAKEIGKNLIGSKNIDQIIKGLPSMKGVDEEFVPKFRFFQIKLSTIKTNTNETAKIMICFVDIS